MTDDIRMCVDIIRQKTDTVPLMALILGSGQGGSADVIDVECAIPYSVLPGFPVSTVHGHVGRFLIGTLSGIPVICMQGRVHMYEGYTAQEAVKPVRVMHGLGAKYLIITNAAGAVNPIYEPGDLVLISDHISLFVPNPLVGPNDWDEGTRFPDMSDVYDAEIAEAARRVAVKESLTLHRGVYTQTMGPSFETPAEIRMIRALGGDLVGMSTVVEVIAARHAGMRIAGISLVSNMAAGISQVPLDDADVTKAGRESTPNLIKLISGLAEEIGRAEGLL